MAGLVRKAEGSRQLHADAYVEVQNQWQDQDDMIWKMVKIQEW